MRIITIIFFGCLSIAAPLVAGSIISKETVENFKRDTQTFRLKNHIPVVYRRIPNSDIIEIQISSMYGDRDLEVLKKATNTLMLQVLPRASGDYPKEKVSDLVEKYSYALGCSPGVEYSSCSLSTINEYWSEGLKLLASLIAEPSFEKSEVELYRERLISSLKSAQSDPERVSDDAADNIYFPVGHPYRGTLKEKLASYEALSREDLVDAHGNFLNSERMMIVVVGSLPEAELMKDLNKLFGGISKTTFTRPEVTEIPRNKKTNTDVFTERTIPTAYIAIEYNAPSARDPKTDAFRLLTRIMNETFYEEVRVKRSLSYATYASYSPLEIGVGQISATTSKPQETLEVIRDVIEKLRNEELTRTELEEQRNVYATTFFLGQEEHSSLAASLMSNLVWRKDALAAYDFPQRLSLVTPRDIKELAEDWLKGFNVSIVYAKDKHKETWSKAFVKYFSKEEIKKRRKARRKS